MATTIIKTVRPSGGDYTSLSAWEAGEQRDLVTLNEIAVAECYSMADTARVLVDGWVTDSTHYIRIYTPSSQRHDGKWNAAKYSLEPPAVWYTALEIREGYTEVDGLQIKRATASGSTNKPDIMLYSGATDCAISNCILTTDGVTAQGISIGTSITNTYIYNCLIYDFANQGILGYSNAFIYNNTIINCGAGISKSAGQSSSTWTVKNVLVSGSTGNDFEILSGTGALTYCASSDATADDWSGAGNRINQTFTFVDSIAKDFHLASGDAGALDFGVDLSADPNLSFAADIEGGVRTGVWDIGADEYIAAGGGSILISGGSAGVSTAAGTLTATIGASGMIAALSLSSASLGIMRYAYGVINGVSVFSGAITASALTGLAGSINALSVLNGGTGIARSLGGPVAAISSLFASAGVLKAVQGVISGASLLTAGITGQSANNISGNIDALSTFAGGVAMGYGIGGSSLSTATLTGYLHEIYSSSGLVLAASSVTGSPVFSGRLSPTSLQDSSRFDVTRHGGGALPLVHTDSATATVTQDNNNPRVTR